MKDGYFKSDGKTSLSAAFKANNSSQKEGVITANNTGYLPHINKQQSVQTAILGISASNIKDGLSIKTSPK